MIPTRYTAPLAALLFLALALPPVRHALEASMTAQMLVQLPLLAGVGYLLGLLLPVRMAASLAQWNHRGVTGFVLASFASAYWMLPRLLDASLTEPTIAAAKFLSLPLLVGVALAHSWPRSSFVVRGIFLLELIASLFRLGWLYLVSPVRLCNNYLIDDQQRLGQILIALGAILFLWIAARLLWGRFDLTRYAGEWTDGRSVPSQPAITNPPGRF